MKLNFPHVIEKCSYFVDIRITFFSLRFVLKIQNVKIVYSRLFYAWNHALFMRFSDYVYELCLYWVLKDYDLDGLDITPIVNDIVIDLEETDTESEMSVFSDLDSDWLVISLRKINKYCFVYKNKF